MAERNEFQDTQYAFAAHIRDPEHRPAPPGIEDRRMAIYRELFFNNLRNLLGSMFPVLRKLHSEEHWNRFIRGFMRDHQSKTPYFLELPVEFLGFLQNEYETQDDDYAFLVELAHYEYIELALSISMAADDLTGIDPQGDLLENAPVKSVLAWVYAYTFPVHRISPDFLPASPEAQPVHIAIYRRSDDTVGFLELNPMTARLLHALEENSACRSGRDLLLGMAADAEFPDVDAFVQHGRAALEEMRELEIISGTRSTKKRNDEDE